MQVGEREGERDLGGKGGGGGGGEGRMHEGGQRVRGRVRG